MAYQGRFGVCTDAETGLMLMGARYYAPCIGRFISRDPIGFDGGINLYGYCGGDPVNWADPSGLDWSIGPGDRPWLVFTGDETLEGLAVGCQAVRYVVTGTLWKPEERFGRSPYFSTSAGIAAVGLAPLATYGAAVWAADASLQPNWLASRPEQTTRAVQTAASRCQYAREMGAAGEKVLGSLGYTKNTKVISVFGRDRIPDVLDDAQHVVGEVKNVRYQALTQQLKDYMTIADDRASKFHLVVRAMTRLSARLQERVDAGRIILRRELP